MNGSPSEQQPKGSFSQSQILRRKAKPSPLMPRKRPTPRPTTRPAAQVNGKPLPSNGVGTANTRPAESNEIAQQRKIAGWRARREANGGWWDPPPNAKYEEYPVFLTRNQVKEGLRFHIMKLSRSAAGGATDPTNQDSFPRPVTLHRKDARGVNMARNNRGEESATPTPAPTDEAEEERLAKIQLERDAQKASDLAQIAPVGKEMDKAKQRKQDVPGKTSAMSFYGKYKDEQKKQKAIQYEESLPWILEDADGKSAYVATYVEPLSEKSVALSFVDGRVHAIPLDKHYTFVHKPPFQTNSLEQAEKEMGKKMKAGRWERRDAARSLLDDELRATRTHFAGSSKVKMESATFRNAARSEKNETDELDYNGEDEFQDDDEAPVPEAENEDEEAKEAKERVRRNQRNANLFGDANEQDIIKEEAEEEKEEEVRKVFGKKLTKALIKREKNHEYKSDSDSNASLFDESSSDSDSEADKDNKPAEEVKNPPSSQEASQGTNTPTAKPLPQGADLARKGVKRAGSPNLSEASETEPSRKKKTKHNSLQTSRASTPVPGANAAAAKRLKQAGAGATSDGEATGGEMSDASKKARPKKSKKLGTGAAGKGSPSGSRAGSPAPASGQLSPRASSPKPPTVTYTGKVTGPEIIAAVTNHPQGLKIVQLLSRYFKGRIDGPGQTTRKEWIGMVNQFAQITTVDGDKIIVPRQK